MNFPEQFRGDKRFVVMELTIVSTDQKGLLCADGDMHRAATAEETVRMLGYSQELVTARIVAEIENISDGAVTILYDKIGATRHVQDITQHHLVQLLVAEMQ